MAQVHEAIADGRYRDVIGLLDQAIVIAPDHGLLYHNRGMAHAQYERWEQAEFDFGRAIGLTPAAASYEQRGLARYQMGNRAGAASDFTMALADDPDRVLALGNLAWMMIEDGQFRDAISYLDHAIWLEPTTASLYMNRARAYYELGDKERAVADGVTSQRLTESGQDTSRAQTWE
jgi:tetratricopeptide (TPR) repeat protein